MKAIVLERTGGPEELRVQDVAEPEGSVLDVRAAGINFMDVLIRAGRYPQPPELRPCSVPRSPASSTASG